MDPRYFVICKECFWRATDLSNSIQKCPVCIHSNIERIPMAPTGKSIFGFEQAWNNVIVLIMYRLVFVRKIRAISYIRFALQLRQSLVQKKKDHKVMQGSRRRRR